MEKDADTSPLEGALVEVFRGLSPKHKGELLGVAEKLRLVEVKPPRTPKKAGAAQQQGGERYPT